ncbi:hypothetical protein MUK42_34210 [Musa troglodytarum]|uniref:Uncharacterized protein n=1 Tax=Musa troglodytarum TaxID=320322 RepID=A0A9E7JAH8_9LILI|nr:hypothetical protein MUK42_34210 [Musa troglodytarum]
MDCDDEFGDLYADVHRPIPAAPDPLVALPDGDDDDDDDNVEDRFLFGPQRSGQSAGLAAIPSGTLADGGDNWLLGRGPPAVETPA